MTNTETTAGLLTRPALEPVSIKGFIDFLKNNMPLVIVVSIAAFFVSGVSITSNVHLPDQVLCAMNKTNFINHTISIGRIGLVVLMRLLLIWDYEPFAQMFAAGILLWCCTVSWCYIIAVFGGNTGKDNGFIPFALLFSTSPVFIENFFQSEQVAISLLIQMFCPYVVYFLYAGFLCSEKKKIICAATAIVFILSVYQGFLMIIFSGVFISFLILQENTGYESKVYMRLCLKLFFAVLLAGAFYYLIIYKLISPRILPFTFNSEYNENFYLGKWLKRPFIESVLAVLSQGYILTIGDIPLVQRIVHPIISQINHPEVPSLARIADESRAFGNVLLLPAAVFFLISIVRKACSDLPKGRRLLYVLAGIGVPISIIMFNIITGSTLPYRTLLALPLAMGFMCFYLIKRWKKKPALILSLLALIISVRQMEITAVLAYSERKLYNAEVRLAADINRRIMEIQPEPKKLPVAFIGSYDQTIPNLLRTRESFSRRFFNSTFGPFIFMPFLGYSYELPQNSQWGMITAEAASMPSYPAPGSVQRRANVIVVKLSDDPAAWPRQYGMDIHQWLGR